ncbi:unnamed protein product [Paramecium octaurelia]|uniref:Transmembrane protein n=1 Tax=Paramecium octaurelia TaxID=43137 RepID=A0A8S1W743_PAROT|nr:unnamed protein product [Paramecium octaurelia]
MLSLFIIFGINTLQINSEAITCQTLQMQPKITCQIKLKDCFILEGDEEDYYKLEHIDKEIIQKSFTIPYKYMPIYISMFNRLEQDMIQMKLICQLFLNYTYYITCMRYDTLNHCENVHQLESIEIETNILSEERCDEMYQLEDGRIILFCLKQFIFKQYSVNFQGDIVPLIEYDVSDQVQDQCKKKQNKIYGKNQFIVSFYQCSNWKIFSINTHQIEIVLESKMQDYQSVLKFFPKVSDVQLSPLLKSILYLFEGNHYIQVIYGINQQGSYQLFESENSILKIILLRSNPNGLLITYSNMTKYKPFKSIGNEIVLNYTFEVDNIHLFSNYLFLQNQTQLIIRIDHHLIQRYQILNTPLNFFEQSNLFYQIDKQQKLVQFYRYFPMSSFIEPKQKFIYFIKKIENTNSSSLDQCFRMNYENNSNEKREYFKEIHILKDCQLKQETTIGLESLFQLQQQNFSISNNNNDIINLSIWKEAKEDIQCYQCLKSYQFKSKAYLRYMHQHNFLIFQADDSLYFHNCIKNKIEMIINTKQFEVFKHFEDYFLIDQKNQQIKIIQIINSVINERVLQNNVEIIRAHQVSSSLIIYIKNEKSPLLLSKDILQMQKKYLPQNLFLQQQILFYQELGGQKFIQYPNILVQLFQGDIKCFEFSGPIIISIKNGIKAFYSIIAVQNQTNSILLYYSNIFELQQFYNFTLEEYQFSNPLKYTCTKNKLAILIEQSQSIFIALFSFNQEQIDLLDIISTDATYFEFQIPYLLYLKNGQMRQHYISEIGALIETKISILTNLITQFNLKFKPSFKFQDELNLTLSFQNECYQVYSLKSEISFKLSRNQNLILKISEIFYGPIHNLTIKNNQKIELKNPLKSLYQINSCDEEMLIQ